MYKLLESPRAICLMLALIIIPLSLWGQVSEPSSPQTGAADKLAKETEATASPDAAAADGDSAPDADADPDSDPDADPDSQADAGDEEETTEEAPADGADDDGLMDNSVWRSGAIGLLLEGGLFMWPIAIMGVLATGVIIERYRSLKMVNTNAEDIRDQVLSLLHEDRVEDALKLCEAEQGPVPAVLSSGLRKYYVLRRLGYESSTIEPQVVKAMDDYSIHILAALEKNLAVLATISSAAPMLGFLGTVQGMIVSFKDIVEKMGETNIVEAAAGGIQVSLLTTCFGLIVGIPAFIAYNYYTSVTNRYVLDVEESATDLIESVTLRMALSKRPA